LGKRTSELWVIWPNTLEEIQAVLDAHFADRPINEQNLSNWGLGGLPSSPPSPRSLLYMPIRASNLIKPNQTVFTKGGRALSIRRAV
jgi:hypothetical protein